MFILSSFALFLTMAPNVEILKNSALEDAPFIENTDHCLFGFENDSFTAEKRYHVFPMAICVFEIKTNEQFQKLDESFSNALFESRVVQQKSVKAVRNADGDLVETTTYVVEVPKGAKSQTGEREKLLGIFEGAIDRFTGSRFFEINSKDLRPIGDAKAIAASTLRIEFRVFDGVLFANFRNPLVIKQPWYAFVSDEKFTEMADKTSMKNTRAGVEAFEASVLKALSGQ